MDNGALRATSEAFCDRNRQVSVDRAILVGSDPTRSRKRSTDAIAQLLTAEVRSSEVRHSGEGDTVRRYLVDVVAAPCADNPAHALITTDPAIASDKHFRRLRERLSRIHKLILLPGGE